MSIMRVHGLSGVNLLARSFVAASHKRRMLRRWFKGLSLYSVVLIGLASMLWGSDNKRVELQEASEILESKSQSRKRELADASNRASLLRKQLRAAEAVAKHPNWGSVLALIASKASGHAVLSGLTLNVSDVAKVPESAVKASKQKTDGAKEPASLRAATIVLNGQAQGLADVTDYVLILEDLNVFDSVRVKDASNSSNSGNGGTTRFEIVCKIEERRIGGKP